MAASDQHGGLTSFLREHDLLEIESTLIEASVNLSLLLSVSKEDLADLGKEIENELAQALSTARCKDFGNAKLVAMGANGMVLAVTCSLPRVDPSRLFALKVVFNWGQPTAEASVAYRNEFEVLQRLRPHRHVTRFWSEFVEEMPPFVVEQLPPALRSLSQVVDPSTGQTRARKTQFLLVEYHPATLKAHLAALPRPLAPAYWAKYMRDLARAMHFLHSQNVVHLDLKLDNLLISTSDRVVLCDFGTAKRLGTAMSWGFAAHTGVSPGGNVPHIAPEVLNAHAECRRMDPDEAPGRPIPCGATEVWAVGCLAHEMATGHHPLPSYPAAYGSFGGQVHYEPGVLPELPADYPEALRRLVARMLSLQPGDRPAWTEVVAAFDAAVEANDDGSAAALPAKTAERSMVVSVKDMLGRVAAVEVPEGASAGQVCAAAAAAHESGAEGLALLYRGQMLDSDQPVSGLHLRAESVVYMVPRAVCSAAAAGTAATAAVAAAAAGAGDDEYGDDHDADDHEAGVAAEPGGADLPAAARAGVASAPESQRPRTGSVAAAAGGGDGDDGGRGGGGSRLADLRGCIEELRALVPQGEKHFPAAHKDVNAVLRRVADLCTGPPGAAAADAARVAAVDAGLVLLLASLLASEDPPIAAASALAQMCRHPKAKIAAVEAGLVPSLVEMLDQGEEVAAAAATALCHIARDSEGLRPSGWWNFMFAARELREVVAAAGAVPKLAERLANDAPDSTAVAAAAAALRELSFGSTSRVRAMVKAEVVPALVRLLGAPRPGTVAAAVGVIRHVCAAGDSQLQAVITANALPGLVRLLQSPEGSTAEDAARALLSVARSSSRVGSMWNAIVGSNQFRQALVDAGALKPLVRLLRSRRLAIVAAKAIAATARGSNDLERAVVSAGALRALVPLLSSPQDDVVAAAASALVAVTTTRRHQQLLVEFGGLPELVRLLGSSFGNIDATAAEVLASLCSNLSLKRQVVEAGAIPRLVGLISGWGEASDHAIRALAEIAGCSDLVPAIVAADALPALRLPLERGSSSAIRLVRRVAAGSREEKLAVLGAGLLPELVKELSSLDWLEAGAAIYDLLEVAPWIREIPGLEVGFGRVTLATGADLKQVVSAVRRYSPAAPAGADPGCSIM